MGVRVLLPAAVVAGLRGVVVPAQLDHGQAQLRAQITRQEGPPCAEAGRSTSAFSILARAK